MEKQEFTKLENLIKFQKDTYKREFVAGCERATLVYALFYCPQELNYIAYIEYSSRYLAMNVVAYNTERSLSADSLLMEKFKRTIHI